MEAAARRHLFRFLSPNPSKELYLLAATEAGHFRNPGGAREGWWWLAAVSRHFTSRLELQSPAAEMRANYRAISRKGKPPLPSCRPIRRQSLVTKQTNRKRMTPGLPSAPPPRSWRNIPGRNRIRLNNPRGYRAINSLSDASGRGGGSEEGVSR